MEDCKIFPVFASICLYFICFVCASREAETNQHPAGQHDSFVGMTVWKRTTQMLNIGETLLFDGIILDEGGDYQAVTGRFICPVRGAYYASVTARRSGADVLAIGIYQNEVSVVTMHNGDSTNAWSSDTNSCVIECNAGEYISVRATDNDTSVNGDTSVVFSTFTVILIAETDTVQRHNSFTGVSAKKLDTQTYVTGDTINFTNMTYYSPDYLSNLSQFICQQTGVYLIDLTLERYGSQLHAGLQYRSVIYMSVSAESNNLRSSHNSIILRCEAGERLRITATAAGASGATYSSFNVVMMHPEDNITWNHDSFIGFSGWKNSNQHYTAGETITFDGYTVNEGGHFQPALNRFVCPVAGVYFVAVTVKKVGSFDLSINVDRQTSTVFRLEDRQDANLDISVSNKALIRCLAGEEIKLTGASTGSVYGHINEAFTTFSVILMYQY